MLHCSREEKKRKAPEEIFSSRRNYKGQFRRRPSRKWVIGQAACRPTCPQGRGFDGIHSAAAFPIGISIRSPCGGRDMNGVNGDAYDHQISIHPPCEGGTLPAYTWRTVGQHFDPPAPRGVRPGGLRQDDLAGTISIHPPRVGRDKPPPHCIKGETVFQSTHPCGVGLAVVKKLPSICLFQSIHPVGGGTATFVRSSARESISIHPPRGGWDTIKPGEWQGIVFQSTHPVGGGTPGSLRRTCITTFQSTHPVGGGTP